LPGEPRFSDVSRILFPLTRAAVIYLARMPERPAPFWRRFATFGASAQPKWCGVRLVPEVSNFRLRGKNRARRPCPLLCLAPHGVSHATSFTRRSGGLLPRLFNLAPHHFGGALPFLALGRSQSGAGRYIFCDTFRRPKLSHRTPSLSRGMLPFGVRTFLWRIKLHQRPPVTTAFIPRVRVEFHSRFRGVALTFQGRERPPCRPTNHFWPDDEDKKNGTARRPSLPFDKSRYWHGYTARREARLTGETLPKKIVVRASPPAHWKVNGRRRPFYRETVACL
jgi:hypothetical protein